MKSKLFFQLLALTVFSVVFLGSCEKEKNHTCNCFKPGGGADSFNLGVSTKENAEVYCNDIFEDAEATQSGYYAECNLDSG